MQKANAELNKIMSEKPDTKKEQAEVKSEVDNALLRMAENKVKIELKTEELQNQIKEKDEEFAKVQEELRI